MPTLKNWLDDWRTIADQSTPTTYQPIVITASGTEYEVLSVSGYDANVDGNKPHVKNTIREFNDNIVRFSRATRDLGIVRVITNRGVPMFVIEPGGQVIEWLADTQGISVNTLMKVMRAGDLGRRVRRRDRVALKNSREESVAKEAELKQEIKDMSTQINYLKIKHAELKNENAEITEREKKTRDNLISQNEKQLSQGMTPLGSGTLTGALGKAQSNGTKLTSPFPLPGHFGG